MLKKTYPSPTTGWATFSLKGKTYGKAVNHFYSAINLMDCPDDNRYSLEDYQLANARKILSFSALEIFEA